MKSLWIPRKGSLDLAEYVWRLSTYECQPDDFQQFKLFIHTWFCFSTLMNPISKHCWVEFILRRLCFLPLLLSQNLSYTLSNINQETLCGGGKNEVLRVENQKHVWNDKRKHAYIHKDSKIRSSKLRDGETIEVVQCNRTGELHRRIGLKDAKKVHQ